MNLKTRIKNLEVILTPPVKTICFIQDLRDPNLYRYLTDSGEQADVTAEQARQLVNEGDNIIWLDISYNRIRHEGPAAEKMNRPELAPDSEDV